jgi:xylose isomerase
LRFDAPQFAQGAFTHPQGEVRAQAVRLCIDAAELAAQRGIDHVILWMGPDGFDYPLQADFRQLWQHELDGFRAVCDATPTVRVSLEYKPAEPRRHSVVRNMGEALLMVSDVDRRNFGVTLDYCHLLMAKENPATAAALALQRGKLFGVHLNDGYGALDDGLMVGSVTFWQTVELLLTLKQGGFRGTIYFDTFPDRMDPAAECAANVAMMQRLEALIESIPARQLADAQLRQDAVATGQIMQDAILRA